MIERTESKALQILNVKGSQELVDCLQKESKTDKLKSIIIKASCHFVYDQLKNNLTETLSNLLYTSDYPSTTLLKTDLFCQT